jgi:hypothetical protein
VSEAFWDTCFVRAWPDADLNGDVVSTKSTSGRFVEIAGQGGRGVLIFWGASRQGSIAANTQEAEITFLAVSLRKDVIPAQLLQRMLDRPVNVVLEERNNACATAIEKGTRQPCVIWPELSAYIWVSCANPHMSRTRRGVITVPYVLGIMTPKHTKNISLLRRLSAGI